MKNPSFFNCQVTSETEEYFSAKYLYKDINTLITLDKSNV